MTITRPTLDFQRHTDRHTASEQSAQAGRGIHVIGIWLQAAFNSFRTPLIFAAAIAIVAETGILLGAISLLEWAFLGEDDTVDDNSEGD